MPETSSTSLAPNNFSAEDIGNEFYKLACTFNIMVSNEETRITISGLSENMEAAMRLFEELIFNARADEDALARYIENAKKSRQDSKANQQARTSPHWLTTLFMALKTPALIP
jgi:predicted Zn-dependent peptidase